MKHYPFPWIAVATEMPDSDTTVLICMPDGEEPVWLGYHDGEVWRSVEGETVSDVTHWQDLPESAQKPKAKHARRRRR